jgi:alpha-L-fucosidase 2
MYGYPGAWSEATGIIAPIQECLLSGHDGIIRIFPFAPEAWGDIRFDNLRTEGAFLVSAKRESGKTTYVKIISEKGGTLSLFNPFGREKVKIDGAEVRCDEKFCKMDMEAGQSFEITLIQT